MLFWKKGAFYEQVERTDNSEDIFKRVTAKRFIDIFKNTKPVEQFDIELYFKLVEKIVVYGEGVSVGLLDGNEVNWRIGILD
jgi:hypothetical protein